MATVGVVLATHNGERFLGDQLDSLARQTRLADELVVHDDCSEDRTVEIVEEFSRTAPFPVRLAPREPRLGYARAFGRAARLCRTDLVAFCDQDDVWRADKLERCAAEFERQADVTLVVHSAVVTGTAARRPPSFPTVNRKRVLDPSSTPILPRVPGFAMVVSRRHVDPWTIVHESEHSVVGWDHDDWAATIAAAVGSVVFLPARLVSYRQHEANVWGMPASRLTHRMRVSLSDRTNEEEWYRELALWARDHVRLLEDLHDRIKDLPGEIRRDGPRIRSRFWSRLARVNDARADLYAVGKPGPALLATTIAHAARGDYGRRARGGLGGSSLGRDLMRSFGLLEPLGRLVERT